MNTNSRGAEWCKWDLHIHTPLSICQDYGGEPSFDKFISALEQLPSDVKVIGITDYYFIDGFAKVMEYRNKGRLKNIKKIFPILEFRIDTFGSGNENNLQKINLHIIFDLNENDLVKEINKVKDEFIKQVPLTKLAKHKTKCLSIENLTQEGNNNIQDGFSCLIPPTDKVFDLLNSPTWKDKCFLLLGYKEWSNLDKNQQLKPLKDDLYSKVGAFLGSNFSNNEKNQKWLREYGDKKLLHSLDIHCFTDLDTYEFDQNSVQKAIKKYHCNTWIKADPTFEGLKQILYEPEERVRIQETKPEEKSGYQVIDSVILNESNFWNDIIYFNENLNTIIGGRSTGKSTLLKALVNKIDPKFGSKDEFINIHLSGVSVKWKDGENTKSRDIDYFPQSCMYEIAKDEKEINKVIQDIIRNRDENNTLEEYKIQNETLKKNIAKNILEIFQTQSDIESLQEQLKAKGDKKGIETEITRLNSKISDLSKNSQTSQEDLNSYKQFLDEITENEHIISQADNDLKLFERIRKTTPIRNSYPTENGFDNLSFSLNNSELNRSFKNLTVKTEKEWLEIVEQFIKSTNDGKIENISKVEEIKKKETFIKVTKYYIDNKELNDVHNKRKEEESKLQEISLFERQISILNTKKNNILQSIINENLSYKTNAQNIIDNLSIEFDDVKINLKMNFQKQNLRDFVESRLNQRGCNRQDFIDTFIDHYETYTAEQSKVFLTKALNKEIDYKNYNTNENVVNELFSKNWFNVSYELSYQNDTFSEMSEGKQAFVILKLLLDFSTKKCPILIDQPEDSLDNRAIYNELVQYIKTKKKERQIILVTHNPNVVVSADAENVIVANQNGNNCLNKDNVKFQYINGALEDSNPKDKDITTTLDSQGIREHVCEILEGGKEAFEKREKKYGFKKQI